MQNDSLSRFGEALVALPVELASRRRHDHPVEVHYVQSSHDAPGLPGGSICVVSGAADAAFVKEIRAAAQGGDAGAVAKVLRAHDEHLHMRAGEAGERHHKQPTGEALAGIPAITEVSYRGKPVAEGMIVHPELDAMRVLVPYAGGRVDSSGFVASTYAHGKKAPDVDTVVVVREPELTPIERKVLDQLPEEVNQLVVGDPGIVANWGLAAAGLVFVVVVVAGVLLAEYAKEQVQKKEQENQKQLEQQMEGREVQQQQEAQQQERGEAHAEQQERQAEGQQERQAEGQQERQAEGQQERQAEGQQQGEGQQEHQANSGNLNWFVDEAELVSEIEGLTAGAAIQTLVELRTNLMIQVSCGDPRVGRDCTRAPPRSTSGRGDRSGWRGRGLPAVSAWTISLGALFGAMLVVTATAQFRRFRWAQWLKGHDACAYIPAWTFFAPNPGVNDTRVLWREQLLDGTIGPWHEMVGPQGGLLRAVWNPTKRARKAVTDCGPMAVRMIARNQRSALPIMGLPYLMIVQHMAGRHGSPLGLARQFTVVNTQGADTEDDGLFQLLFVSQWHRQPGVAQDTPLRAPLLPEVPDLAERVAQGKPSAQPEDTRAEHEEGASERVVESEVA